MLRGARSLEITPLREHAGARYPTAAEPLDLDVRDPRTWPVRTAVASILLAAFGPSGCTGQVDVGSDGAPPVTDGPAAQIDPDRASAVPGPAGNKPEIAQPPLSASAAPEHHVDNPFRFDASSFPPNTPWGKGSPGVLPEEVAVAAIAQALAARGLDVATNVAYAEDGVAAELDLVRSGGEGPTVAIERVTTSWVGDGDYQPPDGWESDPDSGEPMPVFDEDDPLSLNELEVRALDADAEAGKRYVVAVSSLDLRFLHQTEDLPPESWESLGVHNQGPEAAIEQLVAAVHQFVDYLEQENAL